MQRGLRVITLQEAKEKNIDWTIIISYFGGNNNIFADCWNHNIVLMKQC